MPRLREVKNPVLTSFAFERDKIEMFDRLYPGIRAIFFRRCLDFALVSHDNFDKIFFSNLSEVQK